jgi:hypothetical protein
VARFESAEEKLVEGFVTIYWFFHTHPLLGRLLETEPETVLPAITTGATPGVQWATDYLAQHIRSYVRSGNGLTDLDPDETAEILVRLCQSLILTPRMNQPLDSEEAARDYARHVLLPLVRLH